ncbi:MAG: YpdA family putative bacillithiol disulfide reductase [Acidobacteriia bacterium]|nr:YpdA family putative bacillithiol disulfide reductase [Terriglobia bacterium]
MKTPIASPVEQIPETLPRTQAHARPDSSSDVLVVGAGPTGLACAIEAQKAGFKALIIDKGCLVNSIYHYPSNLVFFTTPELLEIGDIPFTTSLPKPTRNEALEYYRRVAEHYHLHVRQYEWVKTITGGNLKFRVTTTDRHSAIHDYRARKIVVATGYYDLPNPVGIPGEDLDKVFHYYREPHPYYDADVVVIGGKNSAAEAALDLWRHGARVTLVHRGPQMHHHVKYWVRPDIENRIKAGEIVARFNSTVQEIGADFVVLQTPSGPQRLKNDFVFALTGYHPDYDFLRSVGIELSDEQMRPVCDPENLESNIPGIYVAGVIVAGSRTNEIFIENGRFHGKLIAAHLSEKLGGGNPNYPLDAT